jgi:hypothetical protein
MHFGHGAAVDIPGAILNKQRTLFEIAPEGDWP